MENKNTTGGNFLRITSTIGITFCVIVVCTILFVLTYFEVSGKGFPTDNAFIMVSIILVAILVYSFFVYIMGLIHYNNLDKAKLLSRLGVMLIIILLTSDIYNIITDGISITSLIGNILELTLISIYVVGALKNQKEFGYNFTPENLEGLKRNEEQRLNQRTIKRAL